MCRHGELENDRTKIQITATKLWPQTEHMTCLFCNGSHVWVKDTSERGTVVSTAGMPRSYIIETPRDTLRRKPFLINPCGTWNTHHLTRDCTREHCYRWSKPTCHTSSPVWPQSKDFWVWETFSCQSQEASSIPERLCLSIEVKTEWSMGQQGQLTVDSWMLNRLLCCIHNFACWKGSLKYMLWCFLAEHRVTVRRSSRHSVDVDHDNTWATLRQIRNDEESPFSDLRCLLLTSMHPPLGGRDSYESDTLTSIQRSVVCGVWPPIFDL